MAKTKWIAVTLEVHNAKYNPPKDGKPTKPKLDPVDNFIVFVEGKECLILQGKKNVTFDLRPGQYNLFIKDAATKNDESLAKKSIKITGFEKDKKIKYQVSLSWVLN